MSDMGMNQLWFAQERRIEDLQSRLAAAEAERDRLAKRLNKLEMFVGDIALWLRNDMTGGGNE